jgi:hypothetical protein
MIPKRLESFPRLAIGVATISVRLWRRWRLVFLGWTVIGLLLAGRNIVAAISRGRPIFWEEDVLFELIYYLIWGLFTQVIFRNVEEVDWIEAADNYVELHVRRESHLLRETISRLAARLDPERFLRIRHSTIVNLERVKELRPLFRGEYLIILRDGTELTSSRRYRKNLDVILDR